jgi:MurNAc alpha-1-phosphate uridylyltransferase
MKTIILSAGKGIRMLPLTAKTPKPLLKVQQKSLLEWHIEKLVSLGFDEIIINIAHLGDQIPKTLGSGECWGCNIQYSDEQKEGGLESAGGIIKALPLLGEETFLVVNGDIFTDYLFDPRKVLDNGIFAHLILVPNPSHNLDGDFGIKDGMITNDHTYTFSGIGYYHPNFFKSIPYGKRPLAPLLREMISKGEVSGEIYHGKWVDVGTPERLEALNQESL